MTATMSRYRSLAVLLCAAALASCGGYEKNAVQEITGPVPESRIRFFNFGVAAPAVNFYVGETKMSAISFAGCTNPPASESEPCTTTGNPSAAGVVYGNVAASGLYAGVDPGQHTISGRIAAVTDRGLAISNTSANLAPGMSYSFYQSGRYNATTKTVDAFVVEDPFPAEIDWSQAKVRFVHAIYNANPMTLYARNRTTGAEFVIGGAVAYKNAGAFTNVPNGVYDLFTRYAGLTTNAMTRTNVSFEFGNVYTITARGDITVAVTTTQCATTNTTCLDNTENR